MLAGKIRLGRANGQSAGLLLLLFLLQDFRERRGRQRRQLTRAHLRFGCFPLQLHQHDLLLGIHLRR